MGTILGSSSGPTAAGLGDLGEPPSSPGLSLPVGTRRTLRTQAGRPAEAGPGWEQDRPLRRAGTSRARGGGARGSSPGAGVAAPAAGGSAAAASAPAAARRRGRGPALRPPLRLQPRRGRRSPSRAQAEPLPEPCPRTSPPPGGAAPHQERQVRVRAGGASYAGKGEVPAPQSFGGTPCPHAPGLRELHTACRLASSGPPSAVRSACTTNPGGSATASSPRVPTSGGAVVASAGSLRVCNS